MRLEDTHRSFIQMIMHAGIMCDHEVVLAVEKIFRDHHVILHVRVINEALEPLGMMIKSENREFTGEKFWMLMTTTNDETPGFPTQFGPGQMELLKRIYMEIITSDDGCVGSMVCLNFCSHLENRISQSAAEEFLNEMYQRMWLDFKDGIYYMGIRSIMEMMPYFREIFAESFKNCPLCKKNVFHGRRCENCQAVSHLYCLAKMSHVQPTLKCGNCGDLMSADDLPEIPEEPVNDMFAEPFNESRSAKNSSRQPKRRRVR